MKSLLLALLLFPLSLLAQKLPTDPETGKITYSEVIEVPGQSQKQLHDKAQVWIAENFRSAKDVTQLDTEESIIIKGNTAYGAGGVLHFTFKVYFKDGRYKYEATDFLDSTRDPVESGMLNPKVMYKPDGSERSFGKKYRDELISAMAGIGQSFKNGMNAKAANDF